MSRSRNIKPGFFRNAELVELPVETRLLFIGLWGLADREGRMADRPKQIKMEIYPADNFDVDAMLNELVGAGFVERYEVNGIRYLQVVNFTKHQNPHRDEKASTIPAPCEHGASTVAIGLIPDSCFLIPETSHPVSSSVTDPAAAPRDDDQAISHASPAEPTPAEPEPTPDPAQRSSPTRCGELCIVLRGLGVDATPGNPVVMKWANGLDVSDAEACEAVQRARIYKPQPARIAVRYLDAILLDMRSEAAGSRGGAPPPGKRGGRQAAREAYLADAAKAGQRLGLDNDTGGAHADTTERDISGESTRLA